MVTASTSRPGSKRLPTLARSYSPRRLPRTSPGRPPVRSQRSASRGLRISNASSQCFALSLASILTPNTSALASGARRPAPTAHRSRFCSSGTVLAALTTTIFTEGVSEDILAALSHVGWLFVIARSTSFVYVAPDRDARAIATELGVTYVLDGSVRRSGSRVRISVELVDGASGRQLWSARYDRELTDIFDIQDEISETIAGEIQPELARSEQERARSKRDETLRAWDLHQRAMWHCGAGHPTTCARLYAFFPPPARRTRALRPPTQARRRCSARCSCAASRPTRRMYFRGRSTWQNGRSVSTRATPTPISVPATH